MGDRLTEQQNRIQTSQTPYGDIFDELFPHYLLMGMTPEQYWDGEFGLKSAYRKAYRMRLENEQRLADRNNWYMGQYMMRVLQCMPLLVGGLNVKRGTQLPEYPDKPFFEEAEMKKNDDVGVPYIYVIDVGAGTSKDVWLTALTTAKTKADATVEVYVGAEAIADQGYTFVNFLTAAEASIKTETSELELKTGFATKQGATDAKPSGQGYTPQAYGTPSFGNAAESNFEEIPGDESLPF